MSTFSAWGRPARRSFGRLLSFLGATFAAPARLRRKWRAVVRKRRAFFESLEQRSLLAVAVWDGGGVDDRWSTAANWRGDVAPRIDDSLVFPVGAARTNNTNDFASGSRFQSITIATAGYSISGNSLVLLEGVAYQGEGGDASLLTPISLGAVQSIHSANDNATLVLGAVELASLQSLTIDGRGDVSIQGVVSGSGGLTKSGDGRLTLAAENTYQGATTIVQGSVIASRDGAFGATTSGTIVGAGTSVILSGGVTVAENFAARDFGAGLDLSTRGALRASGGTAAAPNELTGTITLTASAGIGVDSGGYLKVSGAVLGLPGVSDAGVTKFGAGTLELAGSTDNAITGPFSVLQGAVRLNKTRTASPTDPTPRPFAGPLVIGDAREGVTAPEAARVELMARDQIPEVDFFSTGVLSVTTTANGTLDLAGYDDRIGGLTMQVGRGSASQVTTGAGLLTLLGDIAVVGGPGSGSASPAATICGRLDLGAFFSGLNGGVATRTIDVGDTALPGASVDLVVAADITGASH
ncbi:MAG TPA: autotransporter-associated beta strand repeat-containing protein, partial [Pirellulaceae bacterium]|nr:autotransporter-associated beta strand repeat-containing protein [Pirellulaceae bacterium]